MDPRSGGWWHLGYLLLDPLLAHEDPVWRSDLETLFGIEKKGVGRLFEVSEISKRMACVWVGVELVCGVCA